MKWKITSRFLLAIIMTIVLSFICFLLINLFLFFMGPKDTEKLLSVKAPNLTLEYSQYIQYQQGNISIPEDKLKELKELQSWIQVLDENGTEIYSQFKPEHAPQHYTPGEIIATHKYSGMIEGYTIFVGLLDSEGRSLSYIMGFPGETIEKVHLLYNPQTLLRDLSILFLGTLAVIVIIAIGIGFFLSTQLTRPIVDIISGIKRLSQGEYTKKNVADGLYEDVYASLNHLSDTLQLNEKERAAIEQMRSEWIGNITHDLKTPLASIKGYAEVLLNPEYELSAEERTKYAEIILNKSEYIGELVEDLKLTYQLKNEVLQPKLMEENLVDIARDTIIDILNHPTYEEAKIHFCPMEEELPLLGDRLLLKRAISNLLYNALIHNPAGTEIEVRVMKRGDRCKVIEIEDHGIGIPEEELDRLFDRYYRGTNTGEAHKGSGLGMAIAKQIIQAHRGNITVTSKINEGTKVRIIFDDE